MTVAQSLNAPALNKVLGLQPRVESGALVVDLKDLRRSFQARKHNTHLWRNWDRSLPVKVKIHLNVQNYKTRSMLQCVYVLNSFLLHLGQMHTDHT